MGLRSIGGSGPDFGLICIAKQKHYWPELDQHHQQTAPSISQQSLWVIGICRTRAHMFALLSRPIRLCLFSHTEIGVPISWRFRQKERKRERYNNHSANRPTSHTLLFVANELLQKYILTDDPIVNYNPPLFYLSNDIQHLWEKVWILHYISFFIH